MKFISTYTCVIVFLLASERVINCMCAFEAEVGTTGYNLCLPPYLVYIGILIINQIFPMVSTKKYVLMQHCINSPAVSVTVATCTATMPQPLEKS